MAASHILGNLTFFRAQRGHPRRAPGGPPEAKKRKKEKGRKKGADVSTKKLDVAALCACVEDSASGYFTTVTWFTCSPRMSAPCALSHHIAALQCNCATRTYSNQSDSITLSSSDVSLTKSRPLLLDRAPATYTRYTPSIWRHILSYIQPITMKFSIISDKSNNPDSWALLIFSSGGLLWPKMLTIPKCLEMSQISPSFVCHLPSYQKKIQKPHSFSSVQFFHCSIRLVRV